MELLHLEKVSLQYDVHSMSILNVHYACNCGWCILLLVKIFPDISTGVSLHPVGVTPTMN